MSDAVLTYDQLVPGQLLGTARDCVQTELSELWNSIYGQERAGAPLGLATVLMMRAYLRAVARRPPGGVHARQRLELLANPRNNETVVTEVRCDSKEIRRERRFVDLGIEASGAGGRPLFRGQITVIWAR